MIILKIETPDRTILLIAVANGARNKNEKIFPVLTWIKVLSPIDC